MKSSSIIALGAVVLISAAAVAGEKDTLDQVPIEHSESIPDKQLLPVNRVTSPSRTPPVFQVQAEKKCHPNYSGCLKADATDYDCAGGSGNGPYYTGRVQVYGSDPFGLDRDHDGVGCE